MNTIQDLDNDFPITFPPWLKNVVVEIPDQFCGLPKRPQVKVTVLARTFELLLGLDLEVGEEQ